MKVCRSLAAVAAAMLGLSLYAASASAGSVGSSEASGAARPDQPTIIVSLSPLQPSDKALAPLAVDGLKCAAQPSVTADSAATEASGGQQQYAQALTAAAESLQQALNSGDCGSLCTCTVRVRSLQVEPDPGNFMPAVSTCRQLLHPATAECHPRDWESDIDRHTRRSPRHH